VSRSPHHLLVEPRADRPLNLVLLCGAPPPPHPPHRLGRADRRRRPPRLHRTTTGPTQPSPPPTPPGESPSTTHSNKTPSRLTAATLTHPTPPPHTRHSRVGPASPGADPGWPQSAIYIRSTIARLLAYPATEREEQLVPPNDMHIAVRTAASGSDRSSKTWKSATPTANTTTATQPITSSLVRGRPGSRRASRGSLVTRDI